MANLVEMYADESYGGDVAKGPLCLAMYLYEKEQGILATEEWQAVLNDPDLPHPLPYFRTSDCTHAQGVFKGLDEHCDRIQRKLIPIPKQRSIVGFASTVDQRCFAEIVPPSKSYPNPYTFLAQMLLGFVRNWVRQTNYSGKIIYNFEAGHRHRPDAEQIMKEVEAGSHGATLGNTFSGHAFVKKEDMPLLQSADLFAWHNFTDFKRREKGLEMRKDFMALGRPQDKLQMWTAEHLRIAVPLIQQDDNIGELIKLAVKKRR